jgi:hypothetical protein
MTRLNLLEVLNELLTAKKEELENKRGNIYVREQKAISDALLPFFSEFHEDVNVEVQRGSVYFKMDHPECTYKKELFSLYLREDWSQDDNISFKGIDLSYYSTSTKGIDSWELRRLRMLGILAEILAYRQQEIVDTANAAANTFKAEYKEVYAQMNEIGKELRAVEELIRVVEKEKIQLNLQNDGVEFEKGKNVQLKFNYSPNVKAIKLVDFSKSGKKATAVFTFAHGDHTSREENVNVSSIIDQVYGLRNNIVQHTLAE